VKHILAAAHFPGRERDEAEVRNYYKALEHVESLAAGDVPIGEETVQRIHALAMTGKPSLMADLLAWITVQLSQRELPVPIVAAVTPRR
jgi:hypothetical protein